MKYDLVIIGGGPGGYVAAIRAAQLGFRTALVERRKTLGGTCLNVGCIPSKALLDSSELFARLRDEAERHGIGYSDLTIDVTRMMARKAGVVSRLTSGVASLIETNGVEVFNGTGRIAGSGRVEIGVEEGEEKPRTLETERILLATGSEPVELPHLPFDGVHVISSTEALALPEVPKRLTIVGAGVIGLEMGSVWARLGADVTVVEMLPRVLAGWPEATAKTMQRELQKQGFTFRLSTSVTGASVSSKGVQLSVEPSDRERTGAGGESVESISTDVVLVAVGRRAHLASAGLDQAGVATDRVKVVVDDEYRTSVPGIYAIGDMIPGPMLAHKAEEEGIVAVERMAGIAGHVAYGVIPNVLYTWPEAASIGKSEEELSAEERPYRKGSFPFAANGRALAMESGGGSVTILADERSDRILGAHIVGPWASDLIAEIAAVMEFGGSSEDIARMTHAHPTLSEAVREAALGVDGRMIHGRNRRKEKRGE